MEEKSINIGDDVHISFKVSERDDKLGDFYNAINEVVCYFQNTTIIPDELLASALVLKANSLKLSGEDKWVEMKELF